MLKPVNPSENPWLFLYIFPPSSIARSLPDAVWLFTGAAPTEGQVGSLVVFGLLCVAKTMPFLPMIGNGLYIPPKMVMSGG